MNYLDYHIIETTLDADAKLRNTAWVSDVLAYMRLNRYTFATHVIAMWRMSVYQRAADFRRRINT